MTSSIASPLSPWPCCPARKSACALIDRKQVAAGVSGSGNQHHRDRRRDMARFAEMDIDDAQPVVSGAAPGSLTHGSPEFRSWSLDQADDGVSPHPQSA